MNRYSFCIYDFQLYYCVRRCLSIVFDMKFNYISWNAIIVSCAFMSMFASANNRCVLKRYTAAACMLVVLIDLVSANIVSGSRVGSVSTDNAFYQLDQADYGYEQILQDLRLITSFVCGFCFTHVYSFFLLRTHRYENFNSITKWWLISNIISNIIQDCDAYDSRSTDYRRVRRGQTLRFEGFRNCVLWLVSLWVSYFQLHFHHATRLAS